MGKEMVINGVTYVPKESAKKPAPKTPPKTTKKPTTKKPPTTTKKPASKTTKKGGR